MITGFNTDVEHDGVTYHVQTEDKGMETPLILSLVYVGGAILASKRSPYDDLIGAGFDSTTLNERLHRQHKLICAAVSAGRIEDLKRLNRPDGAAKSARKSSRQGVPALSTPDPLIAETAAVIADPPAFASIEDARADETTEQFAAQTTATTEAAGSVSLSGPELQALSQPSPSPLPAPQVEPVAPPAVESQATVESARREVEHDVTEITAVEVEGELHVSLMEERDYKAGEIVTLRVRVSRGPLEAREAVLDATVTVKVLGTEFRPLILTSKTDQDGVAIVHAWLPRFTTGRAAILVRAAHDGYAAEMRRAVRHL